MPRSSAPSTESVDGPGLRDIGRSPACNRSAQASPWAAGSASAGPWEIHSSHADSSTSIASPGSGPDTKSRAKVTSGTLPGRLAPGRILAHSAPSAPAETPLRASSGSSDGSRRPHNQTNASAPGRVATDGAIPLAASPAAVTCLGREAFRADPGSLGRRHRRPPPKSSATLASADDSHGQAGDRDATVETTCPRDSGGRSAHDPEPAALKPDAAASTARARP